MLLCSSGTLAELIVPIHGVDDSHTLALREVACGHVFGDDPAHHCGRGLFQPAMTVSKPVEADHGFKLILSGGGDYPRPPFNTQCDCRSLPVVFEVNSSHFGIGRKNGSPLLSS